MDYTKLHKRIQHMMEYETDDFFININIDKQISELLYDFQLFHLFNLLCAIRSNSCIVDCSDTGTGKTWTSLALCKQLGLRPIIICPKTLINNWKSICKQLDIQPLIVTNYDTIKYGNCYGNDNDIIKCEYITIAEKTIRKRNGEEVKDYNFVWKLPKNTIIIFDEAHMCKNPKSINGKLLLSLKDVNTKILLLSATLVEQHKSFHIFGYILGLYKKITQGKNWINGFIADDSTKLDNELSSLNKALFPKYGSRMRIKELGDKFPQNQILSEAYDVKPEFKNIINKAFKNIRNNLSGTKENMLGEIMKARHQIEICKVDILVDLAIQAVDNGLSVAIFVSFTETIQLLSKLLKTKCIVDGKTDNRDANIEAFQKNEEHIIIVNSSVSTGISLHDVNGRQRISLISPSLSSTELIQTLGRIHRVGALSPALQRIIYCAGTCEEIICKNLKDKLKFLSSINDNDLITFD